MASRLRAQITSMGENIVNRFSILDVGPVEDEKAGASRSSGRNKEKRTGGKRGEADNAGSLAAGDASSALHFPLVWIDLEMTGLDVANDTIMEIAVIVTDGKLEKEVEGPNLVIQHTDTQLASMNDWCIDQHGRSGLTQDAESQVLDFVKLHIPEAGVGVIAGSSIHVDLQFIKAKMPRLAEHLSWRILDVSTITGIALRWFPSQHKKKPTVESDHRAMSDIRDSISLLKFYRSA
ncbi:hypothetical protein H632_c901p0 [Helicosporidium sp. ATCC 50920]|nr:hypothetical protein H632_c901p0 [Helicosporidium sp. ATCC 50920]|eukprot:KDD75050.1 hypothetical protein H632_c901p0 [Helicosporidium sp. ATCC 50920]